MVDVVWPSGLSYADRALEVLSEWPALKVCRAECGAGLGLAVRTRQIVHLHRPDEAELYLTWPVIDRMNDALRGSAQVEYAPGSDWVRIRLECETDVTLLSSLVSVAIQANTPAPRGRLFRRYTPCPTGRADLAPSRPARLTTRRSGPAAYARVPGRGRDR